LGFRCFELKRDVLQKLNTKIVAFK